MYLNQTRDPGATLNNDAHYRPWREFWARPDVADAVAAACGETRATLARNETQFERKRSNTDGEFYSQIVKPWFVTPDPTDDPVRLKLRRERLDSTVREQGLIELFYRQLPAALRDVPGAEEFLSFRWRAKDWSEMLNASVWSALDETLAAHEAPSGDNRQKFAHLMKIYGFSLTSPATHLADKIALSFARCGLLRMHFQGAYLAAVGPVYRAFYREVYAPVTAEFGEKP